MILVLEKEENRINMGADHQQIEQILSSVREREGAAGGHRPSARRGRRSVLRAYSPRKDRSDRAGLYIAQSIIWDVFVREGVSGNACPNGQPEQGEEGESFRCILGSRPVPSRQDSSGQAGRQLVL